MHPTYKGVTLFLLTRIFLLLKSDHILVILLEMQLNPAVKMRLHPVVHPLALFLMSAPIFTRKYNRPGSRVVWNHTKRINTNCPWGTIKPCDFSTGNAWNKVGIPNQDLSLLYSSFPQLRTIRASRGNHKDLGTNHKFKMAGEGIFQGMAVFLNVSAVYQRYVEMYCK